MDYLLFFLIVRLSIYFIFLLICISGLSAVKINIDKTIYTFSPNTSVIVCVRNGEKSLPYILNDLSNQSYKGNIEFIIVDDNSNDNTKKIIQDYSNKDKRFKYVSSNICNNNLNYKKRAIDAGISISKYDYFLFTDVDCRVNKYWATSMMNNYKNPNINYIIGPSIIKDSNYNLVSKFQSIDFFMLILSSLSTTQLNWPLASTGQNQSYKKSVFNEIGGFNRISHLLQGDDTIFLQLCNKNTILNAKFSTDINSFVHSKEITSIKEFLLQRIRWAADGKIIWKYNIIFYLILLSTLCSNIIFFIYPIILLKSKYFLILSILLIVKFFLELFFYLLGRYKLNLKLDIQYFLFWFIINIPYVLIAGIMSFFISNFKWRNRRISI